MKKYDFVKDEFKEQVKKEFDLVESCSIDLSKEYKRPDFILKIKNETIWSNIGSLGNFSCITGAAKSRKSFTRFFFEACCIKNGLLYNTFYAKLPENKKRVIYIDTEQSKSSVLFAGQRILKMSGNNANNYNVFSLREKTYIERSDVITAILEKYDDVGIMFIDGIADLASCNNDEVEGNRVAQLLMTWTSKYNIHIMTVIHQPRSHGGATGHLGATIEKKAESIISAKKDGSYSIIESKMLRNSDDFTPFPFIINSEIIPELINENTQIVNNNYYEDEEEIPF